MLPHKTLYTSVRRGSRIILEFELLLVVFASSSCAISLPQAGSQTYETSLPTFFSLQKSYGGFGGDESENAPTCSLSLSSMPALDSAHVLDFRYIGFVNSTSFSTGEMKGPVLYNFADLGRSMFRSKPFLVEKKLSRGGTYIFLVRHRCRTPDLA